MSWVSTVVSASRIRVIAEALYASPRTVEHHVTALLTKLGAATRRDAVRRAAALTLSDAQ